MQEGKVNFPSLVQFMLYTVNLRRGVGVGGLDTEGGLIYGQDFRRFTVYETQELRNGLWSGDCSIELGEHEKCITD